MISQVHLKYVFEMNTDIVLMLHAKDLKISDLSTYISKSLTLLMCISSYYESSTSSMMLQIGNSIQLIFAIIYFQSIITHVIPTYITHINRY
jgi:hypothetical protein